jgi:hypothetical protein
MTMAPHTRSRPGADAAPAGTARRLRRRSVPLAAGGVVLVVACALVFAEGWLRAGDRQPVLALARPVAAGQPVTAADLEVVRVSAAGPVSLVPASGEAGIIGSTAAVALPAGSLLAAGDIGTPPPAAGQVRLGVALKAGQYPPDLAAGQDVDVLSVPASGTSGTSGSSSGSGGGGAALPVGEAVVLSVSPAPASGGTGETVAELQVSQDAMPQVAAASAAGQIDLATIPAGG